MPSISEQSDFVVVDVPSFPPFVPNALWDGRENSYRLTVFDRTKARPNGKLRNSAFLVEVPDSETNQLAPDLFTWLSVVWDFRLMYEGQAREVLDRSSSDFFRVLELLRDIEPVSDYDMTPAERREEALQRLEQEPDRPWAPLIRRLYGV